MNKKLILSFALSGLMFTATAQTTVAPAIPRNEKMEQQIEALLKKMTLDEKVGQMCELAIDVLKDRKADSARGFVVSEAMLDSVIGKYKVGSILNVPDGIAQTPPSGRKSSSAFKRNPWKR